MLHAAEYARKGILEELGVVCSKRLGQKESANSNDRGRWFTNIEGKNRWWKNFYSTGVVGLDTELDSFAVSCSIIQFLVEIFYDEASVNGVYYR